LIGGPESPFERVFYNGQFILFVEDRTLKLYNLATLKYFSIKLEDLAHAKNNVFLVNFIENKPEYSNFVKENSSRKSASNKKKQLSSKKKDSMLLEESDFIDYEVEENFLDFRAKVRNRFIFEREDFLIYTAIGNNFSTSYVDLHSGTIFELSLSFEVIRLSISPYHYTASENEAEFARLLLFIGREDVLLVKLFWIEGEKYFESLMHLSNIEFMWSDVIFIDPYRVLVQNENNEFAVVQFSAEIIGKFL